MDWVAGALFWLVLAVVGGVVGNAGWEFLKPRGQRLLDLIFKLLTLNQKIARDEVYQRAANHQPDSVSVTLLAIIGTGICMISGVFSGYLIRPALSDIGWAPIHAKTVPSWTGIAAPVFFLLLTYVMSRAFSTLQQVRHAVVHFNRACDILAPEIAQADLLDLRRQFAAMKGEDDYKRLWAAIRAHQKRLSIELPF